MWKHWVARASTPERPFINSAHASKAWTALQRAFPDTLGAVLMPNHLHLILPAEIAALPRLSGVLSATSRLAGKAMLWQKIPEPVLIRDVKHLRRQLRYVALNPCRSELCKDPLEWPYSTHRDIIGATVRPWVTARRLATVLKERSQGFEVRFHAYVSGDPSVSVDGTAFPKPASPKEWSEEGIMEVVAATCAAFRAEPEAIRRRGPVRQALIQLAWRQGWRNASLLARLCEVNPQAVRRIADAQDFVGIQSAALCLGDQRLRQRFMDRASGR